VVLRTTENVTLGVTGINTHLGVVAVVAVELVGELTTGVVLLEATNVTVPTLTIGLERGSLLSNGIAEERNRLLSEGQIVGVERPESGTVVGVGVPLSLGDGADHGSDLAFTRLNDDTFSKVNLVGGTDEVARASRRLGNQETQSDTTSASGVSDTELEGLGGVLVNVAETERRLRVELGPSRAISLLELEQSDGRRTSSSGDGKSARATVGSDLDPAREGTAFSRIKLDDERDLSTTSNGLGQVLNDELADLEVASASPDLVRTTSSSRRVLNGLNR
jgi:hypothetical protein